MKLCALAAIAAALSILAVPHVASAQGNVGVNGCGVTPVPSGLGTSTTTDTSTGNLCVSGGGGGGGGNVNLNQVGGTNVVTGGVAGSLGTGGLAANGSAVAGNPNLIAGSDGTNARTVATDTSGNVKTLSQSGSTSAVTQATAANLQAQVQGPGATGATISGNPVRIGATDASGNTQNVAIDVSNQDTVSAAVLGVRIMNFNYVNNGATYARWRTPSALGTTGTDLGAVGLVGIFNTTIPAYTNGQYGTLQMSAQGGLLASGYDGTIARSFAVDTSGNQKNVLQAGSTTAVTQATAANLNAQVVGAETAGSAVTGLGLRAMGSDGTNARDIKTDTSGDVVTIGNVSSAGDAASSSLDYGTVARNYIWNGTTWKQQYNVGSAPTNGTGTEAIADVPHTVALFAPVTCSGCSTLLGKSSLGNLYVVYLTNTDTVTHWLWVVNTTAAPVNGSFSTGVASGNLQNCVEVGAGVTASLGGLDIPEPYSTGIYFANSTTGCGASSNTLTLSTIGFMHGLVK